LSSNSKKKAKKLSPEAPSTLKQDDMKLKKYPAVAPPAHRPYNFNQRMEQMLAI